MRSSTEYSRKHDRFWLVPFLIIASLSIFMSGRPNSVWGEPQDKASLGGEGVVLSHLGPETYKDMRQFKAGDHLLGFQPGKIYFASLDHALSVEFLGTPGVMPEAGTAARGTANGSKVPSMGKVVYQGLWEGISLTYEAREGSIAESTYQIEPWADVSKIRLRYNVPVEAQGDGSLKFKFDRGYLRESPPVAWQEIRGERVPVAAAFRLTGGEVGFTVGLYDPSYPLTIDPTYAWHTFYGSSEGDGGSAIAIDANGNVYVTGTSGTTWGGPGGQSPLHAHSGGSDILVMKLDSNGAYQWHTFYGSIESDLSPAIAIDANGNVYVTATSKATWSGPDGQSPLHAHSGGSDILVMKLDSGGAYQWHTFYGSNEYNCSPAIAIDVNGNIYIAGTSKATWDGPGGQSPLHPHSGYSNIFVLKIDSNGTYQWHTFCRSSKYGDYGQGVATDGSGNVYIAGSGTYRMGDYIIVLKLDSNGSIQWYHGYGFWFNHPLGIATAGDGNVYVTGVSGHAWNGPGGESPLHAHGGSEDIFVLKLDGNGSYQWHTFYGYESGGDGGSAIATDSDGSVYVTGLSTETWSGPEGQRPLHAHNNQDEYMDLFVLKLDGNGSYKWHTFYGSLEWDGGEGIGLDTNGNIYVTGPSHGSWQGDGNRNPLHAYGGNSDILVLKLNKGDFLNVTPNMLMFDALDVGETSVSKTLTITNLLATDLVIDSILLTGPDAEDFILQSDSCSGKILAPLEDCTVEVSFSPKLDGSRRAYTSILSETPERMALDVPLLGGAIPDISVTPVSLDFGELLVGAKTNATITISNVGAFGLAIGQLSLVGMRSEFDLNDTCSRSVVAPSSDCSVTVIFSPRSEGSKSAILLIPSNDPMKPEVQVSLTGTGVTPSSMVTLLSPNGGEEILSGSTYLISWRAPLEATSFKLFYSLDDGTTWRPITTEGSVTVLSYLWKVPETRGNKRACRLKVVGYNGSQRVGSDVSDAPFSIEVVKLLSPNGWEVFQAGDTATIEWWASQEAQIFRLMFSCDDGLTWRFINYGIGVTGTKFTTIIPPTDTGIKQKCLIKVIAYNASGEKVGHDRSDESFTVETVKLTEPNGGGLPLKSGDPLTITWETYATLKPIAKVLLFHTLDGGTTWEPIATLPGLSSSYSWNILDVATARTECKVKVVLKDENGVTQGRDMSDSFFTIEP